MEQEGAFVVVDHRYDQPRRYGPFRSRLQAEAALVALMGVPLEDPQTAPRNPHDPGVVIEARPVQD